MKIILCKIISFSEKDKYGNKIVSKFENFINEIKK